MHRLLFILIFTVLCQVGLAQTDSLFKNIEKEIAAFRPDTTTPPNDRKTALASKLLSYTGILNVNEALAFKRLEARSKNELSDAEIAKSEMFFTKGNGSRWLNNAMINIYRNSFTEKELKKLDAFFKKNTGKKFVQAFPLVMIKAMMAIEQISTSGGVKL